MGLVPCAAPPGGFFSHPGRIAARAARTRLHAPDCVGICCRALRPAMVCGSVGASSPHGATAAGTPAVLGPQI